MNNKMKLTDEQKVLVLTDMLNECLSSLNQENSFQVVGFDNEGFYVRFDVFEDEFGNVTFAGY